jgi:hypothetical protein
MFERWWALTLLDAAMNRLQAECLARGRGELFDAPQATNRSFPFREFAPGNLPVKAPVDVAAARSYSALNI